MAGQEKGAGAPDGDGRPKIGLVAGNGKFPVLFSRAAKKRGMDIVAVGHVDDTEPVLEQEADAFEWVYVGELGRIIAHFKEHGVTDAVLVGGISKTRAFANMRLDDIALAALAALDHTQDDNVLRAFAGALESHGIQVRASTFLVPELLAPAGVWTKRGPTDEERADLVHGYRVAKKIGELDIGQCVAVSRGSVVAVEAIEGTDAMIRRAGELCGPGAVVAKTFKPSQDDRFDLPACGAGTVRTMIEAGAAVLGIEAGRALVFDMDEMAALADEAGICLVGLEEGWDKP